MRFRFSSLSLIALALLTACASTEEPVTASVPMFEDKVPVDPSDAKLHDAIQQFLVAQQGPKNSQYEYSRVDLNNDGLREGLVLFNLPHSYWCGWSGCSLAIFEAGDNHFTLLSQTSQVRGPIVVGETKTNGWDDIGIRLTGTDSADRNVMLKYDGSAYPAEPVNAEPTNFDLASLGGTRLFP